VDSQKQGCFGSAVQTRARDRVLIGQQPKYPASSMRSPFPSRRERFRAGIDA